MLLSRWPILLLFSLLQVYEGVCENVCVFGEDNIRLGWVHPVGNSLSTIFFAAGWDSHVWSGYPVDRGSLISIQVTSEDRTDKTPKK